MALPLEQVMSVTGAMEKAGLWRREPYRLFFPLGFALAWAGVGHWPLHAAGVLPDYRLVFHAMTQVQGFLMAFAVGFLFTMIPRRTASAPPAAWQMVLALVAPVGIVVSAWLERWALSQVFWLLLAFTVVGFLVSRFRSGQARRRPPNGFVWIPVAFLLGIVGSALTALRSFGPDWGAWHAVGKGMVLQGLFIALVIGVGSLALPLMTRGEAPPDGTSTPADRRARGLHLFGAAVLAASFPLEHLVSTRLALALRAAVLVAGIVVAARLWKLPHPRGWNRRLIWIAGWMLPLGYTLAALVPGHTKAFLHVAFIGGFGLLTLAVSAQVVLAHAGPRDLMLGRPWQAPVLAGLLLAALVPRALMDYDPARFYLWMTVAASLFLAGTLVWASLVGRWILARPPSVAPGAH